jgi:RNA polymerase sigma factor (sigma-70 family)
MDTLLALALRAIYSEETDERVEASTELVLMIGPTLNAFVARRAPPAVVEDIQQESLITIVTKAPPSPWETSNQFWGWCYQITRRKCVDAWRNASAQQSAYEKLEEIQNALDAVGIGEESSSGVQHDLQFALSLLRASKSPCVEFLIGYYINDWDYAELARQHGISSEAMRARIERCVMQAQKLVEQYSK